MSAPPFAVATSSAVRAARLARVALRHDAAPAVRRPAPFAGLALAAVAATLAIVGPARATTASEASTPQPAATADAPASRPAGPARFLEPAAATEDARILRAAIESMHPGYGRFASDEATQAVLDAFERRVADGITDVELVLEVSRVLAFLRCDHTKAELPDSIETYRREVPSYLPCTVAIFDGRLYVEGTDPATSLTRGDEILSINGIPAGRVLADVAPLVSVDGWTDETARVEMTFSSEYLGDAIDHFWPMLYGWPTSWTIETRAPGDAAAPAGDAASPAVERHDLAPITYDDWLGIANTVQTRSPQFRGGVDVTVLDDGIAIVTIETFINYRKSIPPDAVFDAIFAALEQRGVDRLILDLRQCGGGSTDVPHALLTYLIDEPVAAERRLPWIRTNDVRDLRPYLTTWDESAFAVPDEMVRDLGNGFLELGPEVAASAILMPRENRFDGTVVALSGPANASGATVFLALAQAHADVTVIGEPTGGSAEGPTAGIIFFLELPNSGIVARIPGTRQWVNVEQPAPGRGVDPDVLVRPTADDWRAGRDVVQEAALEWLRTHDDSAAQDG